MIPLWLLPLASKNSSCTALGGRELRRSLVPARRADDVGSCYDSAAPTPPRDGVADVRWQAWRCLSLRPALCARAAVREIGAARRRGGSPPRCWRRPREASWRGAGSGEWHAGPTQWVVACLCLVAAVG
ncbi:hypothetical protein E2562_028404 [Oryza meyeriana var. granulata]|uniref:Uncharacterized protein n=1 Tax=Oryza meyeriana var. granulata TaxID=110450 RepID=A0A6G1E2V7_9ORYZ|nr:hypothetical protein E2562_028404 [Oryza meyeriana var. granulata]